MNSALKAGLAGVVIATAALASIPAQAADLNGGYHGSMKDAPYHAPIGAVGRCYVRGDVGYSLARDPNVKWPVYSETFTGDANANGIVDYNEVDYNLVGDAVRNVEIENTWVGDIGMGCGSGSRGFRAEALFSFRGDQKIDGEPEFYRGTIVGTPVGTPPGTGVDPLHTSLQSYTLMANLFYDIGNFRGFVPYVGAGVGAAYNIVDEVYFTQNPNLTNRIAGDKTLSFAWSVMAGVGYQVSERAVLDFGYRYIDLGKAESGRVDNAGFVNPAVKLDDLGAHEFKVGLRYHFGHGDAGSHQPMK